MVHTDAVGDIESLCVLKVKQKKDERRLNRQNIHGRSGRARERAGERLQN